MKLPGRRHLRSLRAPTAQLVAALALMVGGAALIALWVVGLVLMAGGVLWGLDALLRDNASASRAALPTHEDVLDRYRRAR